MTKGYIFAAAAITVSIGISAVHYETQVSSSFRWSLTETFNATEAAEGQQSDMALLSGLAAAGSAARTWEDHVVLQHVDRAIGDIQRLDAEEKADSQGDTQYFIEHRVLYETTSAGRQREERRRRQLLEARRELNEARVAIGMQHLKPLYGEPGFVQ